MAEPEAAAMAALADHHGFSARKIVSPFSDVDEQITDAIILLNLLPDAIERHARQESNRSPQKAVRSQQWVRGHESELIERVDVGRLAMFMGMGIDPNDDAMLRALLQPLEVPEGVFHGIEVSQTGVLLQGCYEPKRKEPTRPEPEVQAPGLKRKQPESFGGDVERPQYIFSSQNDLERRQVAGPKRRRQDTSEDDEPSGFQWLARPAFGPRLRPEDAFEAGVREHRPQIQSGLASARPLYGSRPRSEGILESGVPDFGPRMHSDPAVTRPFFGSRARPEVILDDADHLPTYESRLQSGFAGAESAPNPRRRQHDVFDDGTRPPFQSGPMNSRFRFEEIYEGSDPHYRSHIQDEFASGEQELGFEPKQPIPIGNQRSTGEMIGPKRKAKAPPNQETPQQGISGAAKVAPVAKKAKAERWKKKYIIVNCPVVVPYQGGFVELRCDRCYCNSSGVTGKFWLGIKGFQSHLRKIHEDTTGPPEIYARCIVRSVSAEEVKQIESGELVIEKLFYRTVKGGMQDEGATGRAQRGGGGEREGEEEEEEAEARPVKTRKRHNVRDFSKGKLKSTTW